MSILQAVKNKSILLRKIIMKSPMKILSLATLLLGLFYSSPVFSKYIVRPQDQAVFHNNQGVAYINQGDAEKALFEFKTATEISPEYTEGWNNLGLAYLFLKKYDLSRSAFLRSIEIDSKYPAPYNHLASLSYTLGNYEEAVEWTKKAIKKDKKFAEAYYNQGLAYEQLALKTNLPQYYASSEESFRNATEANSRHYLANYELGNLYKAQGKYEQAIIRYKSALEIQPSFTKAWTELGNLYLIKGENNKAQFAFDKAMASDSGGFDSHLNMGIYYIQEKNFVLAEKELNLARAQNPQSLKVLFNLAYAKFSQAEDIRNRQGPGAAQKYYNEAIARYQAVLQKFPSATDALYNLGYTYTRMNNSSRAEEYYQKTLQTDPSYPRALFGMAAIKLEVGDKPSAVQYLCQFIQKATPDLKANVEAAQKIILENGGKCR